MRKVLIAFVAFMSMSVVQATAESRISYGHTSPDQVRVRVGSPEHSVTVRVPFPHLGHHGCRGPRCGHPSRHVHRPGCGHPIHRAACGQARCAPVRQIAGPAPRPVQGYMPTIDCEKVGGIRTVNPNTGAPTCFVPNQ